jgi:mannose-binding-like lectin 2
MGNAMVMTQYICLTPDMQNKQGALWSWLPCFLKDWELQVHFKIHEQEKKNVHEDGLVIWYTRDRMQPDNHNVISLKLFELIVERTPEEDKLHQDVFLPSVDNVKCWR